MCEEMPISHHFMIENYLIIIALINFAYVFLTHFILNILVQFNLLQAYGFSD